jgi:deoxyribose-phosphate aldolase
MADPGKPVIAIGSDHAGFALKQELKSVISAQGYRVIDCGTNSKDPVDYPIFAQAVADKVSSGSARFGVIVNGAGIGSAMVANKVKGVRAALCYDITTAKNAREHNDANVLTLGAGQLGSALAAQIVNTFLTAECTVERHLRRVKMIDDLDRGKTISATASTSTSSIPAGSKLSDLSAQQIDQLAERVLDRMSAEGIDAAAFSAAICGEQICTNCGQCADKTPDHVREIIQHGADRISYVPGKGTVPRDIAKYIDHTLLKPDATEDDIRRLCAEAREFEFASVCINPTYVAMARDELKGTSVKVCTVVGFPLGTHTSDVKSLEARKAIRQGAKEIDMVINIGALKSGNDELVYHDIRYVVEACKEGGALSKVIIETALLTDDEKVRACELAKRAYADYVKTSTGFASGGATDADVELMSRVVAGTGMGVKASGGIRTREDAEKMIAAGATRIGASAGVKIVQEATEPAATEIV